jgi:hypothetical protein
MVRHPFSLLQSGHHSDTHLSASLCHWRDYNMSTSNHYWMQSRLGSRPGSPSCSPVLAVCYSPRWRYLRSQSIWASPAAFLIGRSDKLTSSVELSCGPELSPYRAKDVVSLGLRSVGQPPSVAGSLGSLYACAGNGWRGPSLVIAGERS